VSAGDVTEITCDGCTAASDWYCVKCWNGIVRELHDAEVQRDAAKWREKLAVSQLEEVRARVTEFEQLLALRTRQRAHALVVKHGAHGGATYEVLYSVQHGDLDLEEASRVIDAICDARVGGMAADQALVVRAMRDGRSTIHWRADETAATALIRERDLLAVKVEELHARMRLVEAVTQRGPRYVDMHLEATADSVIDEVRAALRGEGL
jgi:hypothetical protein